MAPNVKDDEFLLEHGEKIMLKQLKILNISKACGPDDCHP